jgi:hypothetical protein
MTRVLWLIFAALALIAAGLLLQFHPDRLALAVPTEPQTAEVRIQHEFVRVSPASIVSTTTTPVRRAAAEGRDIPVAEDVDRMSVAPPEGSDLAPPLTTMRSIAPASRTMPTPPARTPAVERASNRDRTLFEKARRAVVGDGRYRPEPFPRVRDHD